MHSLDSSCVAKWGTLSNKWVPQSITIECPLCAETNNFLLKNTEYFSEYLDVASSTAECPYCYKVIWIWVVEPTSKTQDKNFSSLLVYPTSPKYLTNTIKNILPLTSVSNWENRKDVGRWLPELIHTTCPHCNVRASFSTKIGQADISEKCVFVSGDNCPNCNKKIFVWVINPQLLQNSSKECEEIGVFPSISRPLNPLYAIGNNLPNNELKPVYRLDTSCVGKWEEHYKYCWSPTVVNTFCSICGVNHGLKAVKQQYDKDLCNVISATLKCESFNKEIYYLWIINPNLKEHDQGCDALLVYPISFRFLEDWSDKCCSIETSNISRWHKVDGVDSPKVIASNCPNCDSATEFDLDKGKFDQVRNIRIFTAECQKCHNKEIIFLLINPSRNSLDYSNLVMYPFQKSKVETLNLSEQTGLTEAPQNIALHKDTTPRWATYSGLFETLGKQAIIGNASLTNKVDSNAFSSGIKNDKENKADTKMDTNKNEDGAFDIAIICALQKPELEKVIQTRDNARWEQIPFDREDPHSHCYHKAIFKSKKDSSIRVIAGSPTRMGLTATAVLTTKMILKFRPKVVIMVGIAAGTKSKSDDRNFGDILVAAPAFDYATGKIEKIKDGDIEKEIFRPDNDQIKINSSLYQCLLTNSRQRNYLDDIKGKWLAKKPATSLELHIGPLGSGPTVINSYDQIDKLREHWRKLIGIEMEVYAVYLAASETIDPNPLFLSFKSICDFAENKDDSWQDYAAYTAAEYCYKFIVNDLWDKFCNK